MRREFISTLWGIWLHKNELIFKGIKLAPHRIIDLTKENSRRYNDSMRQMRDKERNDQNNSNDKMDDGYEKLQYSSDSNS